MRMVVLLQAQAFAGLNFDNNILTPEYVNSMLFINPGIGVRYTLSSNAALNIGAGIHSQVDGTVRESFLNLKGGLVYIF